VGFRLGTTMKYQQRTTSGAAEIDLGTTIKYLRQTTSSVAKRLGRHNEELATHNERRRMQRPELKPGITGVPPFTKAAPHTLFFACFFHQQEE
jgi:hypothetical protein